MIRHDTISDPELHRLIRQRQVLLGGNRKLNIYGTLSCRSGKRMQRRNRVFFTGETEAIAAGYRPCGHCMHTAYLQWKRGN